MQQEKRLGYVKLGLSPIRVNLCKSVKSVGAYDLNSFS